MLALPKPSGKGRDYDLHIKEWPTPTNAKPNRYVGELFQRGTIPSKPKAGDRQATVYSKDDLNALWATADAHVFPCLVSLKPPPHRRIQSEEPLISFLKKLKKWLTNNHKRNSYPPCLCVTEFDPIWEDPTQVSAGFHIGFTKPLSQEQEGTLKELILDAWELHNNQGGAFHYKFVEGSNANYAKYLSKDRDSRKKSDRRFVKFQPPWLGRKVPMRLWYTIGLGRHKPARDGSFKQRGFIRASVRKLILAS